MTVTDTPRRSSEIVFAIFLIVAGAVGWWAAFNLTVGKFEVLENPSVDLACDFSVLVQCGKNLSSPQGAVFGFPNPLLGMGGFVAPIAVGVGLLAGARFARWFWVAFNIGVVGALTFVIWLISQSIFVLEVLCPWCMVVWLVTIPLFWALSARNLANGVFGRSLSAFGRGLLGWVIPVTIVCYAVIVLLAQVRLNALFRL